MAWRPSVTQEALYARAAMLRTIRAFFDERAILEVQTPVLNPYSVTDPAIESIEAAQGFLQTSPEYAMKRLLCAYGQSIYQICPAFRLEEKGRWHNPEFTMLEWYVVGATMFDLLDQMDALMQLLFDFKHPIPRISYRDLFLEHTGIDPFCCEAKAVLDYLHTHDALPIGCEQETDCDTLLQIVMTHCIEPALQNKEAVVIIDYPVKQAALSKLAMREYGEVAERFELYIRGIECGNGFHELQDAKKQQMRFEHNQLDRQTLGLKSMAIDHNFIQALAHGLPACSGVAIGLDRLLMLQLQASHISDVAFTA